MEAEVVVADNGSTDGSLQLLAERFPEVRRIALEENYGFTGGYNRALAEVEAEYYVLLNTDADVAPDWLAVLRDWMKLHPRCGVCGPKLLDFSERGRFEYAGAAGGYVDRLGYPFCRGRVMHKVARDRGQYDRPAQVLWVSGACLMVRSSVWKQLGGLDDRFFAHMEEIDFCWRAQLAGWTVEVVPKARVYHVGGGTLATDSPFKMKLNYRNNLLLLENNLPGTVGPVRARLLLVLRRLLDLGSALVYRLQGKKEYARSVLEAHREFRQLRRGVHGKKAAVRVKGRKFFSIFVSYLIASV
jgi:GT2 family glycosyltransferase